MITKKEFMKKLMMCRPTAKEFREAAEKCLKQGAIDLEKAPDNFLAVYPLAAAILGKHYDQIVYGGSGDLQRKVKREAGNLRCFV